MLSTGKVGKRLGVCPQTIRNYLRAGKIQGRRLPSGEWRIPISEIEKLLEPLEVSGA